MISFYPGPSKIDPNVGTYMKDALQKGILSINHRSKEFVSLSKDTIQLLKKKLNIPASYSIFFTSSATECWEIIAQSLIKTKSIHLYNGAFGEKWFEYTQRIKPSSKGFSFNLEEDLPIEKVNEEAEVICVVQNETSNGTQLSNKSILDLKTKFKESLIAVDATSSLAGIKLEIKNADIWFASVQKCFGLPAGMGILICSPAAIQRAEQLTENQHYNSLTFMIEKMKDWQTSYTPNVLGIYLLHEVLNGNEKIDRIEKVIKRRHEEWYTFLDGFHEIQPLVATKQLRSHTVIAIKSEETKIKKIKDKAKKDGILLGNGYGQWSKTTFRIANFPAISEKEIKLLKAFLKKNVH